MNEPSDAVYTPGARVRFARLPAPGSGPPGSPASSRYATSASRRAMVAMSQDTAFGAASVGPVVEFVEV